MRLQDLTEGMLHNGEELLTCDAVSFFRVDFVDPRNFGRSVRPSLSEGAGRFFFFVSVLSVVVLTRLLCAGRMVLTRWVNLAGVLFASNPLSKRL